ncbi:MAG: helix-turn-helix transcriptional regulator [Planctomycetia bacterium]|nr:helix-turn-helix transcriptional regulator [Planctomycetia bacterium]
MTQEPHKATPFEGVESDLADLPRKRLEKLLEAMEERGISQADVAKRVAVPAPYLSDVKIGRRPLSELFARRFFEEFGVDHQWLLGQQGSMEVPPFGSSSLGDGRRVWLPAFAHPISGDPTGWSNWDGTCVELAGMAAIRVLFAERPYILRFGVDDRRGRLRRGDLVLISQAIDASAEIQVVKAARKMFLARRAPDGTWERLSTDGTIDVEPVVIGHCVGVIWSAL